MKRSYVVMTMLLISVILFKNTAKAQPDYTFKNPVLTSGIALQNNAKYTFPTVKPGVDAVITIKAQVGGVTLSEIDNNGTGFDEAFQPFINVAPNADGYVEFQVDFVNNAGNQINQNFVPVTCIDIDGVTYGDGVLYEKDQVQFFPGFVDFSMAGGNLAVTQPTGWALMRNTSGFSYSGIDTAAKDVMATVVNRNISSFLVRIGAQNTSPTVSEIRYRSVYFKTFNYGHPQPLPNRTMLSISGAKKQNGVELKGMLSSSHSYDKMIIERSTAQSSSFNYIGEMNISGTSSSTFSFTYLDTKAENGANYYRIRLVGSATNVQEISNTIMVKMKNDQKDLEVINTIVHGGNPILSIWSQNDQQADLQFIDMSGRLMISTKTNLNSGVNNIYLSGMNSTKGYCVLIVRTKNNNVNKQILIQ